MTSICIGLIFLFSFTNCDNFGKRVISDYKFYPEDKTYMRVLRTSDYRITEFSDINKNVTSIIEYDYNTKLEVKKRYYPVDGNSWFTNLKLKSKSYRISDTLGIDIDYNIDEKITYKELNYSSREEDVFLFRRIKYDVNSGLNLDDFIEDNSGNNVKERVKRSREGKKDLPNKYKFKDYKTEDYCKLQKKIEILCTFNFEEHN